MLSVESTGIYLTNGVAFDKDGNQLMIRERGKLTWAVKAIRAAWDKVTTAVKTAIGGTAGLETILGVVDNFTGAVEDAMLAGCKVLGMNDTVAYWEKNSLLVFL
ncbi:hypothetical protein PMSD_20765 [Paenibacillus macquariensis subsp. defensor]|nr:hypothetical protein PMSD_20765 [Paenibacillus macquariensis subsp. defensor]